MQPGRQAAEGTEAKENTETLRTRAAIAPARTIRQVGRHYRVASRREHARIFNL
jgi:hypothetical protein